MFRLGYAYGICTTRFGLVDEGIDFHRLGVSDPPYDRFNLGDAVGEDLEIVSKNRGLLANFLKRDVYWMQQVHSATVTEVLPTNLPVDHVYPATDALLLNTDNFQDCKTEIPALAVMTADCVPLLLSSRDGKLLVAVHAGLAGFERGIVLEALRACQSHGYAGSELLAALGPSIRGSSYEVDSATQDRVRQIAPPAVDKTAWGTGSVDVAVGVALQLHNAGVEILWQSEECTFANHDYYSYRREGTTGRQGSVIWI